MSFWLREIVGWLLVAIGLWLIYVCYTMLRLGLMIEAGPNLMRGIRPDEARILRVTTGDLPTQCSACP